MLVRDASRVDHRLVCQPSSVQPWLCRITFVDKELNKLSLPSVARNFLRLSIHQGSCAVTTAGVRRSCAEDPGIHAILAPFTTVCGCNHYCEQQLCKTTKGFAFATIILSKQFITDSVTAFLGLAWSIVITPIGLTSKR